MNKLRLVGFYLICFLSACGVQQSGEHYAVVFSDGYVEYHFPDENLLKQFIGFMPKYESQDWNLHNNYFAGKGSWSNKAKRVFLKRIPSQSELPSGVVILAVNRTVFRGPNGMENLVI